MRYATISGLSVATSVAASFFMEPIFPLGDWRWLLIAAIGLLVAWILWFTDPKRRWQSFRVSLDGREVAKKIQRIPKRHTERAEAIYLAYRNLNSEVKQFPEQADYGYWIWLNTHWPDRAVQFATNNLHMSLYDAWKERAKQIGISYAPPSWWKRVWARVRW